MMRTRTLTTPTTVPAGIPGTTVIGAAAITAGMAAITAITATTVGTAATTAEIVETIQVSPSPTEVPRIITSVAVEAARKPASVTRVSVPRAVPRIAASVTRAAVVAETVVETAAAVVVAVAAIIKR